MKTRRIAYVCADPGVPVFGRKGCSIHVQEIIRAFRRRGAEVTLFAARLDGPPPTDFADLATYLLPCPREGELAAREQLCLQANKDLSRLLYVTGPFDLVYERYSLWSFSGMNYARTNCIPGLLEVNAPLIAEQSAHRGLIDRPAAEQVAGRVFGDASTLLGVSDEVAADLRQRGVRTEAIQVIPNGVNPERFPHDLAPTWGWPQHNSTFSVGFVGTLKPWHGVSALIDAFARLYRQFPDSRLLLVGDGPERANLEARINQLALGTVTHFTGAVAADKIPGLLAAMDVAVAPYPALDQFYFSPLKAYEYMAAGRATVASRIGQLKNLIQHEQNGLLCEPGDVADLAIQLGRLHEEPALRQRLAAAGRETILRGHTWDHVAAKILQLANPTDANQNAALNSSLLNRKGALLAL